MHEIYSNVINLVWIVAIQLAAWGVGLPVYRAITRRDAACANAGLSVIFSVALGYIALSQIALCLAVVGLLYQSVIVLGTVGCAIMGARRVIHVGSLSLPRISHRDAPLLIAILFLLGHIPRALSPILEHDDLVYHLLIPKLYLENHRMIYLPSNLWANMPHIVEVLYTIPMAIGDFVAPKVFTLGFSMWNLIALYLFALPLVGRFGAGLMSLVYVSGHNVQWHFGLAYIEPVLGFFLLCACWAFTAWLETSHRAFLRILGLVAGFTLACKYTTWFFVAAIGVVGGFLLLWPRSWSQAGSQIDGASGRIDSTPLKQRAVWGAETVLLALTLLAPWIIKNFLYTGNPIYPNMYEIFGGPFWSEVQEMQLGRSVRSYGASDKSLLSYLAIPWRLVTDEKRYFFCPVWSSALMGLWLCAFRRTPSYQRSHIALLIISALGFVAWVVGTQNGRFVVAWIPVVVAAATLTLMGLRDHSRILSIVMSAAFVMSVYQIVFPVYDLTEALSVFSQPRESLVQRNVNFRVCELLDRIVPKDGKVLGLWENRLFFLNRELQADSAYEAPNWLTRMRMASNLDSFVRDIVQSGFTHVVIHFYPADQYLRDALPYPITDARLYPPEQLARDRERFSTFVSRYLQPIQVPERSVSAFRIRHELLLASEKR